LRGRLAENKTAGAGKAQAAEQKQTYDKHEPWRSGQTPLYLAERKTSATATRPPSGGTGILAGELIDTSISGRNPANGSFPALSNDGYCVRATFPEN